MRRARLLFAATIFAAPALAGDGPDVAALGPTPTVTEASAGAIANPFGLPPLDALSATRERPLFSVSRRPPPPPAAPRAPEPAQAPPPAEAPPAPEHPPFTLVGTLLGPGQSVAWLKDSAQALHKMRAGEAEAGWVLRQVGPRSVVFEKGGVSETIALPRAAEANAPIADPDADPPPPTPLDLSAQPAPGAFPARRARGQAK